MKGGGVMEKILNFADLLQVLDTSHPTARRLIRTGQIRAVRVGREYRILESAVSDFLRGGGGGSGTSENKEQAQTA